MKLRKAGPPTVRQIPQSLALVVCGIGIVASACGGGPDLTPEAAEGRRIAEENGCAACHGADGQGGVGPAWQGLHGSTVELDDGTSVAADHDYLERSIVDPEAQKVAGYTINMPPNTLGPAEVASIIAYIEEIS